MEFVTAESSYLAAGPLGGPAECRLLGEGRGLPDLPREADLDRLRAPSELYPGEPLPGDPRALGEYLPGEYLPGEYLPRDRDLDLPLPLSYLTGPPLWHKLEFVNVISADQGEWHCKACLAAAEVPEAERNLQNFLIDV